MPPTEPEQKDIVILNDNKRGNDHIIGDVHGNLNVLNKVIEELRNHDRLFIVGDLIDRGHDSLGVIEAIMKHNEKNPNKHIHIVLGNHEVHFMRALEALSKNKRTYLDNVCIEKYLYNGGDWILKDSEKNQGTQNYQKKNNEEENEAAQKCFNIACNKTKKDLFEIRRLLKVYNYFRELPYIIRVENKNDPEKSFNACHADLLLSDEKMKNPRENTTLTDSEKSHIIWARKGEFSSVRSANSNITYVGHNIIQLGNKAVRSESSTINLDCSIYSDNAAILVNHTKNEAKTIQLGTAEVDKVEKVNQYVNEINTYLNMRCLDAGLLKGIDKNASTIQRKNFYINQLEEKSNKWTPEQKKSFACYLLTTKNHFLKQERHHFAGFFRAGSYSNQTRSIHKAIKILLKDNDKSLTRNNDDEIKVNLSSSTQAILSRHADKDTWDNLLGTNKSLKR